VAIFQSPHYKALAARFEVPEAAASAAPVAGGGD